MKNKNFHPSDQQLLLLADGELSARQADQIRAHLQACWNCRSRMADLEGTIADFMQFYRQTLDVQVPPIDGPRAQLKARLAKLAQSAQQNQRPSLLSALTVRGIAYVCALTVLVVIGARMLLHHAAERQNAATAAAWMLPNPSLTPGATTTTTIGNICSMSDDEVVAPVSSGLRQQVFKEYGIAGAPTANYEVDYLITPGLGGSGDIRNLWPQPRYNTVWNSFVKDQLEEYLHHAVCGGRVSLPVAQHEIASNWISAYKKYFHTGRPLSSDSASTMAIAPGPTINAGRFANVRVWTSRRRTVQEWPSSGLALLWDRRLLLPLCATALLVIVIERARPRSTTHNVGVRPRSPFRKIPLSIS